MKKLLFALAALSIPIAALAQEPAGPGHRIALSLGSALPAGEFRSRSFEADYAPFAKSGSMLAASYSRTVRQYLGLGATAGWRSNAFDLEAFADANHELVRSKTSRGWRSAFVLTDVYLQFGESREVMFYAKGSVGAAFSRSAYLQVQTDYGTIQRDSDKAASLAWGIAGGAQFYPMQRYGVDLQAGLLSTKPRFEMTDRNGNSTKYKQPLNSINLSVGLFYRLSPASGL